MPDLPDFQNTTGQVLGIWEMAVRKKHYRVWAKLIAAALLTTTDRESLSAGIRESL